LKVANIRLRHFHYLICLKFAARV